MYYINSTPTENGNYGSPSSRGEIALPDELVPEYLAAKGFVTLTIACDTVTAVKVNQSALDAYLAEHPDPPPAPAEPSADEIIDILLGGGSDE